MTPPGSGLLDLLAEHGVSDKAARLYLAACRAGPVSARELARLSEVHRVEAYRIIKQLAADGLLAPTGTRPQRFAALPPNELVDRWIRRASERVKRLESDRTRVLAEWETGRTEILDRDPRKFAVLDGREAIRRFLRKRIGTAQRRVLVSGGGTWLAGLIDGGVARALKEAAGRGVRVRIVTEVGLSNLGEAKHFAAFADLRHSNAPVANRTAVFDRDGALVFVSGEEGLGRSDEEQVALWSSTPSFVQLTREYFRRLWFPATRADSRFVELETPSAAVLPVLASKENVPFQRLKEIAKLGIRASGVREFHLPLPELIETIAQQLGQEIAKDVDGTTPAAVGASLGRYYAEHSTGRLAVVRERPLTLQVTGCFACTPDSTEIGRVMCPQLMRTVLETRLGQRWAVSKPDPTKHAHRGCVFVATAA